MSLFPFTDVEEGAVDIVEELPQFVDYAYINDTFTLLVENDALKEWCKRTLLTKRYTYDAYTWDYGSEIEELIGDSSNTIQFATSVVTTYIEECLLVNPYITAVNVDNIVVEDSKLTADITIDTIYGEVTIDV